MLYKNGMKNTRNTLKMFLLKYSELLKDIRVTMILSKYT